MFQEVLDTVNRIEEQTSKTSQTMDALHESSTEHLRAIADNTGTMAAALDEFKQENKDLIEIIAGKKQVPFLTFILVVGVMAILLIVEKAHQTKTDIQFSSDHFRIKPWTLDDHRNYSPASQDTPRPR